MIKELTYKVLKRLGAAIVLAIAIAVSSCSDDLDAAAAARAEEGLPAEVSVDLQLPDMTVISRSEMQEGLDKTVTSLWVAVYNAESGVRTGLLDIGDISAEPDHSHYETLKLNTFSGRSYIVAVANYNHRYAAIDASGKMIQLHNALTDADTWEKFRAISVGFDSEGGFNVQAPLNALVMSGFYTEEKHDSGLRPQLTVVDIQPGTSKLAGAVHLRRMISQVKFNVKINTKNIKNFEIEAWQVANVPNGAWLHERDGSDTPLNSTDSRPHGTNRFYDSPTYPTVSTNDNITYSFDWWQLENLRSGRDAIPADYADTPYAYRDLEHKDAAGQNTGKYVSLVDGPDSDDFNNYASYVKMQVSMEMTVDENGKPLSGVTSRLVKSTYIVHLGYCEGSSPAEKAKDFNCRRNSKYTYNVTINNINNILVEANREGEVNPGVEGFVTDITDKFYELDAHYSKFNIELTEANLKSFQYYIQAYDLQGKTILINSMEPESVPGHDDDNFKYMEWVELRPATSAKEMARYKPRSGTYADGQTYTLDQIGSNLKPGYYTVFINEYVYETGTHASGNETGSNGWHGYVNRPPRRVWLNVAGETSADGESVYYKAKYALTQNSIQTYYNDQAPSGLGVERTNETFGLNMRNNFNYQANDSYNPGHNPNSGRYNLAQYIVASTNQNLTWTDDSKKWEDFIDVTTMLHINKIDNQGYSRAAADFPMPALKANSNNNDVGVSSSSILKYDPDQSATAKYYDFMRACLNRNRDLDGDGKISANELRWFVPTTAQYVRIILGRGSLVEPVMDYTSTKQLPYKENGYNSRYLAATSDGMMIWLMEGTSDSRWREWTNSTAAPWEVRCVRNLGGDMTVINDHNVTQPAFQLRPNAKNIVELKYYDSRSIREEAYVGTTNTMPVHDISNQLYNRCYKAFEFHDSVLALNDPRLGISDKTISWDSYLKSTNPCAIFNTKEKSGWRVPNQKELTIIGVLGKEVYLSGMPPNITYQISCSYSYFDYAGGYAPGANPDDPAGSITSGYRYPMKLRNSDGGMTQAEEMYNFVPSAEQYGVRCVRDVE